MPARPLETGLATGRYLPGLARLRTVRLRIGAKRRESIRARMTVVTVALLAAAMVGFGTITYSLLQRSLVGRLDDQLLSATAPAASVLQRGEPSVSAALFPAGIYATLVPTDGAIRTASFSGSTSAGPPVIRRALPGLADVSTVPLVFDADAAGSAVRYRVRVTPLGSAGTVVVAIPRSEVDDTLRRLLLLELLVGLAVVLTAGLLTRWSVGFGLRPVTAIARVADRITAGNLTDRVRPSDPQSELGRLGLALNSMLERIDVAFAERTASEERLRRFVSDASHELRTPVTTIRGYAELFGRGASMRLDDLGRSMERIESEAARMGGLIDELLLLARLDEGVPLRRGPVDLAALAADAIADLRAAGRTNPLHLAADAPVVLDGDEARLRQVLANLLTNAVSHTPEGTAVAVGVSREGGEVVLRVADSGPGLAPEVAERAFDRFYRAPRARSEVKGAGLGLSIVSAIVAAHGGKVSVEANGGPGACFVCRLPVQPAT
jgi:two-component system OmpR family sensor kinase